MRITNFRISKCRKKGKILKQRLFVAVVLELEDAIALFAVRRLAAEETIKARLQLRRRHVQVCNFNLDSYSEQQCLIKFYFKCTDMACWVNAFNGHV